MSSPQLEDGYTCIAHEILEALCRVNLSPYESRVMWFIVRKTYGYRKKADRIPLSQISEATGLEKANASRALRSLKQRHIIALDGKQIGLQKDHEKWLGVSPKTGGVSPETLSPETTKRCLQRLQKGVSRDTSKYIKIKDSVKGRPSPSISNPSHSKKKREARAPAASDPRVQPFLTWFAEEFERRHRQPYATTWAKDGKLIKSLPAGFDLTTLKSLAKRFFESDDSWIRERGGFTIGVFVSQINKLSSTADANGYADSQDPEWRKRTFANV